MTNCHICGSPSSAFGCERYDDRYGFLGEFALLHCRKCDHTFLDHNFTPEQLSDLYSNYYPRSNIDLESYRPYSEERGFFAWLDGSKSSAFRWVPKNVRVLDVGCGFGESLGYHRARGCEVYGVEADENIRRVAEKHGFNVHVGLFDPNIYEADFFDYVTMDQVLEHVVDPLDTLRGVARILKSDGRAVISFPNAHGWGAKVFGRKWINWHAPYHLQFYSRQSLALLAEKAGLEIESSRTITPSAWLHFQWIHLITCPEPGEPSRFWAGSACGKSVEFSLMEQILLRLAGLSHKARLNHVITRIFDALGMGDNCLVVLRKP